MTFVRVAVVEVPDLTKYQKLSRALERGGLWDVVDGVRIASARPIRVIIKPDLGAFALSSPNATDPQLIEALIDELHDRGHIDVAVGFTADASALWAENREVFALAELLGYRFRTAKDRAYEVVDLATDLDDSVFPPESALYGTALSREWLHAQIRIVFAKNKTHERKGYSLCLESLIGVLPLADKHLHYAAARYDGDVVSDLLEVAPVHFAIIDAIESSHGAGGSRSPEPIATEAIIASPAICLADQIGALKMGLDPFCSAMFAKVAQRHPLPSNYEIEGSLQVFPNWRNVPGASRWAANYRAGALELDRLVEPWLQRLDKGLFPAKSPIDDRMNAFAADFFGDADSPTSRWFLVILNVVLGLIGHMAESYRTLFDKDSLRQKTVSLGIDPARWSADQFAALVAELSQLEVLVSGASEAAPGLRWRELGGAVLFSYSRTLPINFELFVQRVDVARTIQYMNDYLGGVVVPLEYDSSGRPVRQAERNLYLPQPNYLVLYHGKPIDVTKLEVVEYLPDRHRLYWKTVHSENASASFDDGVATFSRTPEGTEVTITGRQLFTLPSFLQILDLSLVAEFKAALVTHAYRTFFDRTTANFEALVEGREIRLGRIPDEPIPSGADTILPILKRVGEMLLPLLQEWTTGKATSQRHSTSGTLDADGFVHFGGAPREMAAPAPPTGAALWAKEISRFLTGMSAAIQRDLRYGAGE
jgi:uncharacterized protein (DUF362 family)